MKNRVIILFLLSMVTNVMANTNINLDAVSNLIITVKQTVGVEIIKGFPDPAPIYGHLEMNKDFQRLADLTVTNWRAAIDNISSIASDRESRIVLLHSFLMLPPKEYQECLLEVLDLYKNKKIERDEFVHIFLMPPRDENRWLLSFNHKNSKVAKFLEELRTTFKDDAGIQGVVGRAARPGTGAAARRPWRRRGARAGRAGRCCARAR